MVDTSNDLDNAWPLFGLSIETPVLTLEYLSDAHMPGLITAANGGVHDPNTMPFTKDWAIQPVPERGRQVASFYWSKRAEVSADGWHLAFAVVHEEVTIGIQDCWATKFPTSRTAETGSWLGMAHQGKGFAPEMRSAILHLLFDGLGAHRADTSAVETNAASMAVTTKLGYEPNGDAIHVMGDGQAARSRNFTMPRDTWLERRRDDITISGLDPCLPFLGLESDG